MREESGSIRGARLTGDSAAPRHHRGEGRLENGADAYVSDFRSEEMEGMVMVQFNKPTDAAVSNAIAALAEIDTPIHLNVNQAKTLSKAILTAASSMKNLYGLSVGNSGLTKADLPEIAKLTNLKVLYLELPTSADADFTPLADLKNLVSLSVYSNDRKLTEKVLAHFSGMTSLRKYQGDASPTTGVGMNHIKGWINLEELTLVTNKGMTDQDMAILKSLVGLKKLRLEYDGKLGTGALDAIAALPKLENLSIDTLQCEPKEYARLAPLAKTLRKFGYTFNTPSVVQYVTALTELDEITLGNTNLSDELLLHLSQFKKLQKVIAGGGNSSLVSDMGLDSLGELTLLTSVDLSGSKVTDAGMKQLAKLTRLESLAISKTQVTDASLDVLLGLPKLRQLYLGKDTKLSPGAVAKIKAAKKDLRVTQ